MGAARAAPLAICTRNAHVAGDAGGEGRLAQARRAVQEDMAQRFAALRGGIDGDAQPLVDLALADHVAHPLRAKIAIFVVGMTPGWRIGSRGMGIRLGLGG